jgi:purine-binding chemotaxis protein CheW
VDRISDILTLDKDDISPPPTNVDGVDGRLMSGVCTLDSEIVVLLDIDELLVESDLQTN